MTMLAHACRRLALGYRPRLIVLLLLLLSYLMATTTMAASARPIRCFSLCTRSEQDVRCRRCRFREPMRFGKRLMPMSMADTDSDMIGQYQATENLANNLDNEVISSTPEVTATPDLYRMLQAAARWPHADRNWRQLLLRHQAKSK